MNETPDVRVNPQGGGAHSLEGELPEAVPRMTDITEPGPDAMLSPIDVSVANEPQPSMAEKPSTAIGDRLLNHGQFTIDEVAFLGDRQRVASARRAAFATGDTELADRFTAGQSLIEQRVIGPEQAAETAVKERQRIGGHVQPRVEHIAQHYQRLQEELAAGSPSEELVQQASNIVNVAGGLTEMLRNGTGEIQDIKLSLQQIDDFIAEYEAERGRMGEVATLQKETQAKGLEGLSAVGRDLAEGKGAMDAAITQELQFPEPKQLQATVEAVRQRATNTLAGHEQSCAAECDRERAAVAGASEKLQGIDLQARVALNRQLSEYWAALTVLPAGELVGNEVKTLRAAIDNYRTREYEDAAKVAGNIAESVARTMAELSTSLHELRSGIAQEFG